MTDLLTQRLHDTAERIPVALRPASETRRAAEHARRRRMVVATGASAVVVAVVASAAFGVGVTPASRLYRSGRRPLRCRGKWRCPSGLAAFAVGAAAVTPYWHDGVLHVPGGEIETPFPVGSIEVAGDTVLIQGKWDENGEVADTEFALVRGIELERIPAPGADWMELSLDGRIAYWETNPTPGTTRFVTWDTETNTELASRTVPGTHLDPGRLQLIGIGADGIAYWVDEATDPPVMRWDVRADTVEPTGLTFDFNGIFDDQAAPIPDLHVGFEDAYVSPDGTSEVFTDPNPGDSSPDCCATQLRVRPAGTLAAVDPSDVITLKLPEGIPSMRLWDAFTDRGMWWVWWESNQTVLLDASLNGHSYLVRCWTTGSPCEFLFELGTNSSRGVLYMPDWEQDWTFARFPVQQ